jgi:hypothetical protein
MKSKGQVTIEYLLSTLFVIIMLSTLLLLSVDRVPEIDEASNPAEVTMEARRISSMMITSPGSHSYGTGGSKWEKNSSTLLNIESVGFATDYHTLDRDKVENLTSYSSDGLNYSIFRNLTDIDNQYRFLFTYMPMIHTSEGYRRNNPPEDPNITEPQSSDYDSSGNTVRYGDFTIGGKEYNFIVTSHNDVYDTVYKNEHSVSRWDFTSSPRFEVGEEIKLDGRNFTLRTIQNTERKSGSYFLVSRQFKQFGPSFDATASIQKLNRYATLNETGTTLQPLKIEVFAWRN